MVALGKLISFCTNYKNNYYTKILSSIENRHTAIIPTGTCIPFSRRVMITTLGEILPCERVGQEYSFGNISNDDVCIDFNLIAARLNSLFDSISSECNDCAVRFFCQQCILQLKFSNVEFKCHSKVSMDTFLKYLEFNITYIELNRYKYEQILRDFSIT
jgi:uncharacterized protein